MFNLSTLSGINLQTDNYFQYTSKRKCVWNKTPKRFDQNVKEFWMKRLSILLKTSKSFSAPQNKYQKVLGVLQKGYYLCATICVNA